MKHFSDDELLALIDDGAAHGQSAPAHLQSCAACRTRLQEFDTTLELARRLPQPTWSAAAGRQLAQSTQQKLLTSSGRRRRGRASSVWRPALTGSLVTGAIAAALALMFMPADPQPPAAPTLVAVSQVPGAQELGLGVEGDGEDLAIMLDTYLLETASMDELLLELDASSTDDYYALLEDGP